jgi:hypothetical protein
MAIVSEKRFDRKETADAIRKKLKLRCPGIKFSVRTRQLVSGNTTMLIAWTDGPSQKEIQQLTAEFVSSRCEWLTDYWEFGQSTDYVDAEGNVERIIWSADYISVTRRHTHA